LKLQTKILKVISGLILIASILLLIDYYLPLRKEVLITEKYYSAHTSGKWTDYYIQASGVSLSQLNFTCLPLSTGDTLLLSRSYIYHIPVQVQIISPYYGGECEAEYNPFAFRGLFILIPILLSAAALMARQFAPLLISCLVSIVLYIVAVSSLFIG
jgi:hypothetical protein